VNCAVCGKTVGNVASDDGPAMHADCYFSESMGDHNDDAEFIESFIEYLQTRLKALRAGKALN